MFFHVFILYSDIQVFILFSDRLRVHSGIECRMFYFIFLEE